MFPESAVRDGNEYVFRQFQLRDVDSYLSLYETIWGPRHEPEWVRWRFYENPYVDHVPVFVAVNDGEVVATRPFFALRMRVGDREPLALLTVDTMVHPDHRRRGLFTTLTEKALEWYAPRAPSFVFNQPTTEARAGFTKLGWRELTPSVNYHRVQRPGTLLREHVDGGEQLPRQCPPVVTSVAGLGLDVADVLRDGDADAVRERPGVQPETLSSLYRRRQPEAIHAVRDESYYRWRFASPEWRRRTYLADTGRETAGALVRTRTTHEDVTVTQVADIVPLRGGEEWETAVTSLLSRTIEDHRDSDVLSIPEGVLSPTVLLRLGFLPDDRLPLSLLSQNDSVLSVRPLADDAELDRDRLLDPDGWLLGYGERDTV